MRVLLGILTLFLASSIAGQVEVALLAPLNAELGPETADRTRVKVTSHHAFRAVGPFILVEASSNGIRGTFILDSGSPGLILNQPVTEPVAHGQALGSPVPYGEVEVTDFQWGPIEQHDLKAYTIDLSHLDESLGLHVAGLIGYEQLREAAISINYPRQQLTFQASDANDAALGVPLKFRLCGHVPTLRSVVAGKRLDLALDTGSGVNLLDVELLDRISEDECAEMADLEVRGLGTTVSRIQRRRVHLTEVADGNWLNLPFAFADLAGFRESGLLVDGLLGRDWIAERTVTLDYKRKRIYVK